MKIGPFMALDADLAKVPMAVPRADCRAAVAYTFVPAGVLLRPTDRKAAAKAGLKAVYRWLVRWRLLRPLAGRATKQF